jgi:tRNA modification GTPase
LPKDLPKIWVHNKIDLNSKSPSAEHIHQELHIYLSAKTGDGLDLLREHLLKLIGWQSTSEGVFMARTRHLEAIKQVEQFLAVGIQSINQSEIVAENLRMAQEALNSITGEFTPDDLLGEIFSKFCIGK